MFNILILHQLSSDVTGRVRLMFCRYTILTEKEVGVISGVQMIHNDPIVWSRSLPETSHLSRYVICVICRAVSSVKLCHMSKCIKVCYM